MMRKTFRLLLWAMPMMLGLASCTSNDDNSVYPSEEGQEHEAVDTYNGVTYNYPVYVAEGVSRS
jgi:hypothetical protein